MMRRIFMTCVCAMALCLAVFATGTVRAASPQGVLSISPTSVDQEIAPGGHYTGTVSVLNQGTTDYSYQVYVAPYHVTGEDYQPVFTPVPGAPDATKWFTLGMAGDALKAGTQDSVPYTVAVPQGTPAGSYDAVIFAETTSSGAGGVVTHKRVGTIFYIRVSGPTQLKGNVASWSVPWLQRDPITATLRLANTGTVNYKADVTVTVRDIFGGAKYQFARTPEILPQTIRKVAVPWDNGAKFGLFKVNGQATFNGKTYPLATKYVFVASTAMRWATAAIFLTFVAAMIALGRRCVARK